MITTILCPHEASYISTAAIPWVIVMSCCTSQLPCFERAPHWLVYMPFRCHPNIWCAAQIIDTTLERRTSDNGTGVEHRGAIHCYEHWTPAVQRLGDGWRWLKVSGGPFNGAALQGPADQYVGGRASAVKIDACPSTTCLGSDSQALADAFTACSFHRSNTSIISNRFRRW
jgi:hypothetical protein